ncbi:MAG: hypothetical protein ACJ0P4_05345 [Flavobacteriaceae bacterium]
MAGNLAQEIITVSMNCLKCLDLDLIQNQFLIPDQPGNYKKTLRKNDNLLDLLKWDPRDQLANHIKNLS